jgi:hypothetical protein
MVSVKGRGKDKDQGELLCHHDDWSVTAGQLALSPARSSLFATLFYLFWISLFQYLYGKQTRTALSALLLQAVLRCSCRANSGMHVGVCFESLSPSGVKSFF